MEIYFSFIYFFVHDAGTRDQTQCLSLLDRCSAIELFPQPQIYLKVVLNWYD
jgi:hypothetical protein